MKKFMLTLKENKKVKQITVSAISALLALVIVVVSVVVVHNRKVSVQSEDGSAFL